MYVCVNAKLTFVSFFVEFFLNLSLLPKEIKSQLCCTTVVWQFCHNSAQQLCKIVHGVSSLLDVFMCTESELVTYLHLLICLTKYFFKWVSKLQFSNSQVYLIPPSWVTATCFFNSLLFPTFTSHSNWPQVVTYWVFMWFFIFTTFALHPSWSQSMNILSWRAYEILYVQKIWNRNS